MTAVLKNVYIDKLVDIVYEYKNTYHRTIEIKPVNVNRNRYREFSEEEKNKKESIHEISTRVCLMMIDKN